MKQQYEIELSPKDAGPAFQISNDLLEQARLKGDVVADEFLFSLFDSFTPEQQRENFTALASSAIPLPEYSKHQFDMFVHEAVKIPDWIDKFLIEKAQTFFSKQWFNVQVMLGCYSLPYCYLAANGVKVLYQSKRLRTDASKRLQETDDFLLRVLDKSAFDNELKLKRIVAKIRLLHSATRYFILKHANWETEKYGYPVNQEDMAGTNLAFSYIALRGLRKMKIAIASDDAEAYLHLWNVIGYMLGLDESLLPANVKVAAQLDDKISRRQFRVSDEAKELTCALIKSIQKNVPEKQKRFIPGYIRYLIGENYEHYLGLEKAESIKPYIMILKVGNQIDSILGKDLSKKNMPSPVERFHW